jgi:hypothetical protein
MPAHRHVNGGLSTADLDRIRDTLAGGRRPKVVFTASAGQIVGQTGQVVALADPEVTEEWLVVRFGHDELPFSPTDLALPPRGRGTGQPPAPAPAARKETSMPTTSRPAPAAPAAAPPDQAPAKRAATAATQSTPERPAKKATRSARGKAPAALTVTLAYLDGEWTVAAHQGSKVLAKPYLVKPAEAIKLVGMVDVPGVQEAVEQVVAAERAEAEQRAEALRAQLAQVEAQLAELRHVR